MHRRNHFVILRSATKRDVMISQNASSVLRGVFIAPPFVGLERHLRRLHLISRVPRQLLLKEKPFLCDFVAVENEKRRRKAALRGGELSTKLTERGRIAMG